jgi:hypothetical protein
MRTWYIEKAKTTSWMCAVNTGRFRRSATGWAKRRIHGGLRSGRGSNMMAVKEKPLPGGYGWKRRDGKERRRRRARVGRARRRDEKVGGGEEWT